MRVLFLLFNGVHLLYYFSSTNRTRNGSLLNLPSSPSTGLSTASVFEGGKQEFQCEIGLFRKLPGTELFASIVTPEVELDLGEEVQLRSIVRAGDGKAPE